MNIIVHRGTREIGGTCIEMGSAQGGRILFDIGMPLYRLGEKFDSKTVEGRSAEQLVALGVLPDIKGLYAHDEPRFHAVFISHAHMDHYGLANFVHPEIPIYASHGTKTMMGFGFMSPCSKIGLQVWYDKPAYDGALCPIYDANGFVVYPRLMDHSAFDAHGFVVEADGKRVFYTGDFRSHGRKAVLVRKVARELAGRVDCLVTEGTNLRLKKASVETTRSERDIEGELVEVFRRPGPTMVYCSGQNIDRIVSIYRACKRAGKVLVVDPYVANVMKAANRVVTMQGKPSSLPYPSMAFSDMRVYHYKRMMRYLKGRMEERFRVQFGGRFKITNEEMEAGASKCVLIVRPTMQEELGGFKSFREGNFVYSLWLGYLEEAGAATERFRGFLEGRGFKTHYIHSSGHASPEDLVGFIKFVRPKVVIPVHTEGAGLFSRLVPGVKTLKDGDSVELE